MPNADTKREDLEAYLDKHEVRGMLKDCLNALLHELPEEPLPFIVKYFAEKGGVSAEDVLGGGGGGGAGAADADAGAAADAGAQMQAGPLTVEQSDEEEEEEESEEDEEDEDELGDLPDRRELEEQRMQQMRQQGRRNSVSAAPIKSSELANFKIAEGTPKTPEEEMRIAAFMGSSVLTKHLNMNQQKLMMGTMNKKEFVEGSVVIKQGDDGDDFFIVDSGSCGCYITGAEAEDTHDAFGGCVQTCETGDAFGELALMYNAPRAATVVAKTETTLWAVDRDTFRAMVIGIMLENRTKNNTLLKQVNILQTLTQSERESIIDVMTESRFTDGEEICAQGATGDNFYICTAGEVLCTQVPSPGEPAKEVGRLKEGDYFGEIALLTNRPRLATCTAAGDVVCLLIDRKAFTRVVGPLRNALKRNMALYNTYINISI